jgi:carboxyl-terminal processing protease
LIDKETIGESALDNPLPWDKIHETRYPVYWKMSAYLPILEPRHEARMATDPNFVAINAQIEEFKEQVESYKSISLKESTRIQQKEDNKQKELERENTRRKALGLELLTSVDDIEPIEEDTYAKEASEVLLDFIATNQMAQKQAEKKTAQK